MKQCPKCKIQHNKPGTFCSRGCANSRLFTDEAKEKKRLAQLGRKYPNRAGILKGKKPERWTISECMYCKIGIEHSKLYPRKYHKECWRKVAGGYRIGSGVGKSGWYKGVWCDSSYELAWVIYQLDHNRSFMRNKQGFEYVWNNKTHKYFPDFSQNGIMIEIKGFVNNQTKEKLKSVPDLIVLFREDLESEFIYVETKYGKDFIRLYENNPYVQLTGMCKVCTSPCKEKNIYCSRKCAGVGNNRNSNFKY